MKTMLRIVLLGMALVMVSQGVLAQVNMRGGVAGGCGQWIADRNAQQMNRTINFRTTAVVGYLSGLASVTNKNFWGTPGINALDNESVYSWIDNYCRNNPLKSIDEAADALFLERTRGM